MKDLLFRWLKNRYLLGAALLLLLLSGWYLWRGGASGNVSYEQTQVDRGDIENSVSSSGSVSPLLSVTVGSEVSGRLLDVLVDFNSKVKKGQLLAIIDPATLQSRLVSARADLTVQQATVASRKVDVSNAAVSRDQAQRDYDRMQQLYQKGLASLNDQEKARNALEQAQNNYKIAQANLNNANAQIIKMRANVQQAELDVNRTRITSPVDGVVISRKVDPGQTVAATMQAPELFTIAKDLSSIQIEAHVDEADIGAIKEGRDATFTVDAYPDRTFHGNVAQVRINGTSSQNVVTYSVMVHADNPDQLLLPGMTANVKLITDERKNVLRLANASLRFKPAGEGDALGGGAAGSARRAGGGSPGGGPPGGGPPGATAGGGGSGGGMSMLTPEVMKQIGLSDAQQKQVESALADLRSRMRAQSQQSGSSNPLGGGMPNFRMFRGGNDDAQLMRQRIQNALAGVLTEEQMQKLQALRAGRVVRPATVYVLDAKGKPQAREVRIGLADDSHTEIVSGLADGDKVILRARSAAPGG